MDSELMSLDEDDIQQRLHANRNDILEKVRHALREAGLHEYEVKSVNLFLRHLPLRCPAGQHPVWDAVRKPDGTVVYEWVCKQSG